MADVSKTVEIIFGAKNDVSRTIDEISRKFGDFDNMAGKIVNPLAGVADSVVKVDAVLAALAIGGLALAIKASGDFSGKFGEITTLISDTGEPIDRLRQDILEYAVDSTKGIGEINQAIYASISAGVKYGDAIQFVNQAEKLATAGRADLGATTTALISTLNAYGASTDQATKYSDVMFQTVRLGQTTMEALGPQLAKVTGLAANAGVPFETLSAAVAALTVAGLPTEQALTGIKAILQNIIKPTSEAEKMAASLGIQFNATALQTKGFEGVLWDAYRATGGSTEKMAQLFGSVEGLNAVLVLASDKTGNFKNALGEMQNAAGATETAYDKVAGAFENVNQRVVNSFQVMLIDIGDRLMPRYGEMAGAMGDILKGIKVGVDSGAFDPLFAYLDEVGASIALWMKGVAEAMPEALQMLDYSALIQAFRDLGAAFGEYFGELDLTKAEDLAAAMQLLIDIGTGLVRVTTGMVEAFRPFASVIADFFIQVGRGDKETQETLGKVILFAAAIRDAGWAVVATILAIDEFAISMRGLFNVIGGGVQLLWNGFTILLEGIKGGLVIIAGGFVELLDYMTFGMFPGLDAMREKLTAWGKTISFEQDAEDARRGLFRMMEGFVELGTGAGTATTKTEQLKAALRDTPPVVKTEFKAENLDVSARAVDEFKGKIATIPEKTTTTVEVLADGTKIETTKDMIYKTFPDGQLLITNIGTQADAAKLAETKKKIDDAVPASKVMEIQAKIDEARLKESSAIVQKSIEWKAKIDIAQIEASAKVITATFASIDNTVTSTGNTISSMLGSYEQALGRGGTTFIESQIVEEGRRRDAALLLQKDMTEAQVALIKQQTESLKAGNAMIQIDGKGLQPHLEAFMFEILAAIQVKANAEGMKFLVGAT